MTGPVAVIGLGTIGTCWVARFCAWGLSLSAYDPDPSATQRCEAALPALLADVAALRRGPPPSRPRFAESLADAVREAAFVQENAPERLPLKQALLAEIDAAAPAGAVIASSSSALLVTDMQAMCTRPERTVLGHPFNPAHLMPLVEIVGGRRTAPETVKRARAFYEAIGAKPVVLHQELPGHLALRLMAALWREAIHLVVSGAASVEDVDRAFQYGPGPKWTLQGPFVSNHLNADGIESFLERYGDMYQVLFDDLGTTRLDKPTRAAVAMATRVAIGSRDDMDLRRERDGGLVRLLQAQAGA
jgi:carnitine 3-dehydrogenase